MEIAKAIPLVVNVPIKVNQLTKKTPAYFDYAATTPTDPQVLKAMLPYFGPEGIFGNPSSVHHRYGTAAAEAVETARKRIALTVGVRQGEIIWTSGATEANNLAIRGLLSIPTKNKLQLIIPATEHLSVLSTAQTLKKEGFKLEILPVNRKGLINLEQLSAIVRQGPSLVSVMWVNNETGVVQPISQIAKICQKEGALFHVDAAQATGKVDINIKNIPIDLMSLSAHKVYGPKGIGALVVRRKIVLQPLISGGSQELGLRPGTLPVPLIAGMGKAFEIQKKVLKKQTISIRRWHDKIIQFLNKMGKIKINGDDLNKVPHILNITVGEVSGDLFEALPKVALSNSSACTTQKVLPSHVLMNMGRTKLEAMNSLRISFGRYTTESHINLLITELENMIAKLRNPV